MSLILSSYHLKDNGPDFHLEMICLVHNTKRELVENTFHKAINLQVVSHITVLFHLGSANASAVFRRLRTVLVQENIVFCVFHFLGIFL